MQDYASLSHTKWDCKYHLVFIPKYRKKSLFKELRQHLGDVFRDLAEQRESRIHEGHLRPDHVHMMISIPPKYSVAQVVGVVSYNMNAPRGDIVEANIVDSTGESMVVTFYVSQDSGTWQIYSIGR